MANRRTFLKAGGVALAGAAGIAAFGTQRGSAVEIGTFDISDGTVTTNNGVLTELTVSLDYTFDWEGLDFNPSEAVVTLDASGDGGDNWTSVFTSTHTGLSGYSGGPIDGSGTSDDIVDALSGVDFDQTLDGDEKATELDFKLTVTLNPSDDGGSVWASTEDEATVTVENLAPGIGIGGEGGFNGEGESVYPAEGPTFDGFEIYSKDDEPTGEFASVSFSFTADSVVMAVDLSDYVDDISSGAPLNNPMALSTPNGGPFQFGWLPDISPPQYEFGAMSDDGAGWYSGNWKNAKSSSGIAKAVTNVDEDGGVITWTLNKEELDVAPGDTISFGGNATAGGEEEYVSFGGFTVADFTPVTVE